MERESSEIGRMDRGGRQARSGRMVGAQTNLGEQLAGDHPVTPDGRYFVVRGRLWRMADPRLSPARRASLVAKLMAARRDVGTALRAADKKKLREARARVDETKRAVGERGPVWWSDDAPDLNRHMVRNTPYADWFGGLDP